MQAKCKNILSVENHNVTGLLVKKNVDHHNQWLNKNCSADHHFNHTKLLQLQDTRKPSSLKILITL